MLVLILDTQYKILNTEDMRPRKIGMILAILAVLAIGLLVLNSQLNKDSLQPALQQIVSNDETLINLANEGSKALSSYSLQTQNATMFVTTTSDNVQLRAYYKKHYHRIINNVKADSQVVAGVHTAQPGSDFDTKYKNAVQALLEVNTAALKSTYNSAKQSDLRGLMQQVYTNQGTALEQLKK